MSPSTLVLDASAAVEFLLGTEVGRRVEAVLLGRTDSKGSSPPQLHAPELIDVEVVQALRALEYRGEIDETRASITVQLLRDLPLRRWPARPLLPRIWAWRHNVTAYDAAYLALAESLEASVVTTDERLAGAPGAGALTTLP